MSVERFWAVPVLPQPVKACANGIDPPFVKLVLVTLRTGQIVGVPGRASVGPAFGVAGDVSLVQPVPAANSARIAAATMRARRPSRKRSSIGSHLRRVFGIKLEGWVDSDDAHEIPWGPRGLTGCLLDP